MPALSPRTRVDEASEAIALLPPNRLGALLKAARKASHVAALPAARAAGISIATLDEIESGRTTPTASMLAAMLDRYDVAPGEFVPPRVPLPITESDATSDETLRGFVKAVRKWRKAGRKDTLKFRAGDVLALSEVLGTDPGEIERRLIAITGCSPFEARLLRKWFLAALVTLPVASGLLGGIAPSAAAATLAHSPSGATPASVTSVTQGKLTPGALSIVVAAPRVGAEQADDSIPVTVSYAITDARGSGAGWSAQATFTSTDATAVATSESLQNVNEAASQPQTSNLPTELGSTPAVIARAAPGREGMGSFTGQLGVSIVGHSQHSSGQLVLTIAAPASA